MDNKINIASLNKRQAKILEIQKLLANQILY